MKNTDLRIDDDVMAVLRASTVTADRLVLPPGQLERKLYERVNKVLVLAGGKWNRGAKAHLFPKDPREVLGLALETGAIEDRKTRYQIFETPDDVADALVRAVLPSGLHAPDILEPSAGSGALIRAIWRLGWATAGAPVISCVEIRPEEKAGLAALPRVSSVLVGDFLGLRPPTAAALARRLVGRGKRAGYDAVVMNPPFTGGQDARHVLHAWAFLRPGGRLGAIVSAGALFGERTLQRELRDLYDRYGVHRRDLAPGTFAGAGTQVSTSLIVLEKD